ncbi:hypothetical protein BOX15_Mlig010811g1, partial [Macrostomum lignano]
ATMRWRYLKYYLAVFLLLLFLFYNMLDRTASPEPGQISQSDLAAMEEQVRKFESQLKLTREALRLIREAVQEITAGRSGNAKIDSLLAHLNANGQLGAGNAALADLHGALKGALQPPPGVAAAGQQQQQQIPVPQLAVNALRTCPAPWSALLNRQHRADLPMSRLYSEISFDNPDGGPWKQGWQVTFDPQRFTPANKLQVIVVPHSHNDPGWRNTLDEYYRTETVNLLNGMLSSLPNLPRMTFIYAEVSFLSMWWSELSNQQRDTAKQLIGSGRLEIVSGGWVMPDEANSHYFALVDQLVEGHQWLEKHIGVRPNSSWQIDPFGHSSSLSYIYRKAGFRRQLVQRVHYSVKKRLARQRQLEFRWKQLWDPQVAEPGSDMLCHMMPFYSYDIPHTCGPDPKICCQFDFHRLPGSAVTCPWRVPPQAISDANVAARAELLLDQYKKKASLFGTNVLLVPLGDDFRYQGNEWTRQYENYDKLMAYINSRADWNANVKFGTLSEYFDLLAKQNASFPSLTGDFFTYADRDDHYWSGYYTSRPFHKRLERTLEHSLRSAELLFSYAVGRAQRTHRRPALKPAHLFESLTTARRSLGLFQHHDGITGTAKDHVVIDYGQKLLAALSSARLVMRRSAQFLLLPATYSSDAGELLADFESRDRHDSLPTPSVIDIRSGAAARYVVIFNPLARARKEVIRLVVNDAHVIVKDHEGKELPAQLLPQFTADWKDIRTDCFGVAVLLRLEPLSLTRLAVSRGPSASLSVSALAHTGAGAPLPAPAPFAAASRPAKLALESEHLSVEFDPTSGLPTGLTNKKLGGRRMPLNVKFYTYGARPGGERSGAYLFLPDGPGRPASDQPGPVTRVSGPLVSEVHRGGQFARTVTRLYASPDSAQGAGLEIESLANVRGNSNLEVAVRLDTGLGQRNFYSDINCLQLAKRTYWEKLPLQANVYPMPCQAFMQSNGVRLSVVAAQPMGVHSPASGSLELFLDRTLAQDDGLGLAQGVLDNRPTPSTFRLLLEAASGPADADGDLGFPSGLATLSLDSLLHPPVAMPSARLAADSDLAGVPARLSLAPPAGLACDLHLLNLRTLHNERTAQLSLHRRGVSCAFPLTTDECRVSASASVPLSGLFADLSLLSARRKSLSLMYDYGPVAEALAVPPMEIETAEVELG